MQSSQAITLFTNKCTSQIYHSHLFHNRSFRVYSIRDAIVAVVTARAQASLSELTEAQQVAREAPPSYGKAAPALWHSICDDNVPIYVFGHGSRPYGAFMIKFFQWYSAIVSVWEI
jgi:hypothetical protein